MAVREFMFLCLGVAIAIGGITAFTDGGPVDVELETNDGGGDAEASVPTDGEESGGDDGADLLGGGDSGGESETSDDGLDIAAIEYAIHNEINEIRTERDLSRLKMSGKLRDAARYHSRDMAENGYFSHTAPDGETREDRYERVGYSCRVNTGVGNEYATGAENIAYTYADSSVSTEQGTLDYNGNETRIGQGLARQWMNSDGHRKNILRDYWEYEGIGVATVEAEGGTKVIATQNFC